MQLYRNRQNRLVREMVGGDDLLTAHWHAHRLCERLAERGLAGQAEAEEAYDVWKNRRQNPRRKCLQSGHALNINSFTNLNG